MFSKIKIKPGSPEFEARQKSEHERFRALTGYNYPPPDQAAWTSVLLRADFSQEMVFRALNSFGYPGFEEFGELPTGMVSVSSPRFRDDGPRLDSFGEELASANTDEEKAAVRKKIEEHNRVTVEPWLNDPARPEEDYAAMGLPTFWASLMGGLERAKSRVPDDMTLTMDGELVRLDELTEESRRSGEWATICGIGDDSFRHRMRKDKPGKTWRIVESGSQRYRVHLDDLEPEKARASKRIRDDMLKKNA